MGPPAGGKLAIYVDCVSPYSWFGFTNTLRFRDLLNAYGVAVEIIPFFLGGSRDSVGNPFTPAPQAKAAFGAQDTEVTGRLLGLRVVPPKAFPILSLFPIRVATWVKDNRSSGEFEATFAALAAGYWSKGFDISKPEGILEALHGIFSDDEIAKIMQKALTPENKKRVVELTTGAKAFGAPWISAVNSDGERRDYFGNDRWDHVFEHLGVPYTPVGIVAPQQAKSKI